MKQLKYFIFLFSISSTLLAAQKAVINSDESDIYAEAHFDADIIDSVGRGETYIISDKTFGAFYKIKLKSGKIGFIPDHQVDVNGKRFQEKPFISDPILNDKNKNIKNKKNNHDDELLKSEEEDEDEPFSFDRHGVTLQLINYHEDTMGALRVDDLTAFGYKSISDVAWEVMVAFKAPKYYAEVTGGSALGAHLWIDYGINNTVIISKNAAMRYSGLFMGHLSQIKVSTASKTYNLQDVSLGLVLEAGFLLQFKKTTLDFSAKYFFDRNNYGGLGLSLLF